MIGPTIMVGSSSKPGVEAMDNNSDLFDFPAHIHLDFDGVVQEPDYFGDSKVAKCFKPVSFWLNFFFFGGLTKGSQ